MVFCVVRLLLIIKKNNDRLNSVQIQNNTPALETEASWYSFD